MASVQPIGSTEVQTFYKVINVKGNHGVVYELGLNVDPVTFAPHVPCARGAIYFTSLENICMFLDFGSMIAEVEPRAKDGSEFAPWCNLHGCRNERCSCVGPDRCYKFKAPAINITKMYPIGELEAWKDEQFCLRAVQQHPRALQFAKCLTYEVCAAAVKRDGYAVRFLKWKQDLRADAWSKPISILAVQENGLALQFIANQTEVVCVAAVKQNRNAIAHVVNPKHKQACLDAIA